ncbi:MAG: OFA family MFS transporter [Candidatus Latescibacter sp.]|nr:OFA family MFS transporter [Candidatus Latescibacter sp.]
MHKGIRVVIAGTGINLSLGILYTWSIFKESIKESITAKIPGSFAWDMASINDPYAVACLVFAFMMIYAGRIQDKFGPRITAFGGGILVSMGFLLIARSVDYWVWVLGFGGLVGTGLAFGYASATPAALKWFPPTKSGLIAGIVVSGFGLASAYIAPLSSYILKNYGLLNTMMFFGIAFLVVVSVLSIFLVPPPAVSSHSGAKVSDSQRRKETSQNNETIGTLLRKSQFWTLWLQFFIGAGAGLMVISSISGMAKMSMGEKAFIAVAILAIGNASGRILAGFLSDRFGLRNVLAGMFLFQATMMFLALYATRSGSAFLIVLVATLIGFNYGANLSIFPTYAKTLWGMKNFGVNYGLLFTAWGVGGFVMSKMSEVLKASSGSYSISFIAAGVLLLGGFVYTVGFRSSKKSSLTPLPSQG